MHLTLPSPNIRGPSRRLTSLLLDSHVFVRRGVGMPGDQAEAGLLDARADTVEERELPDRRVNDLVVEQLLHAMENRLALLAVELVGLLPVEAVEVGVAPVRVRPARHHEGLHARRRIAERAAGALDQVLELLAAVAAEEGRPLQRSELDGDPDPLQVGHDRLREVRVSRVAEVLAGVEAAGIAGL